MVRFARGNLLDARADALVNTVNEVGVMGKGIALMFRERFPVSSKEYEVAARRKEIHVGRVFVTRNQGLFGPRFIIHFPTKKHWRQPSKIEWVREGLKDLVRVVREHEIHSIAIPPLGCGNGGLDWHDVRREIEVALAEAPDVEAIVYEPTVTYQNVPKPRGVEGLTPARALIAELVRRYLVIGLECSVLEVQKLAWFLQRSILGMQLRDPLKLRFAADRYGPYADGLRHLLNALDGGYLHCKKRLADAGPFESIWFEDAKRAEVEAYLKSNAAAEYLPALERTTKTIDGFESPLGMELLATVDWLLYEKRSQPTVLSLRQGLEEWPGGQAAAARKQRILNDDLLALALERLSTPPSLG